MADLIINAGVTIRPGVTLNGFSAGGGGGGGAPAIDGDLLNQSGTLDLSTESGTEDLMA